MERDGGAGAFGGLGGAGGEFHGGPSREAGHGDSLAGYMICGMKRMLYVDGFNFYYGVKEYWKPHKLAGLAWCDFRALVERHFTKSAGLQVKYFSAAVKENTPQRYEGEHERYANWMRAVGTIADTVVIQGFHKRDGAARDEKQTDVNIAVEMVMDASGHPETRPDHCYLLSGDFDLMPAVYAVEDRLGVPVTVLLPTAIAAATWKAGWERTRKALRAVHGEGKGARLGPEVVELGEGMLASSLLRYELRDGAGKFGCPAYWRLSGEYLAGKCGRAEWRPD